MYKAPSAPYRPMTQIRFPGVDMGPANDVCATDDNGPDDVSFDDDDEAPATLRDPLPWGALEG